MKSTRSPAIKFRCISYDAKVPKDAEPNTAFLKRDLWDDWGKYSTLYQLTIVDQSGNKHEIGQVKIGENGLKPHRSDSEIPPGHRSPKMPALPFKGLKDHLFSVGQDEKYYLNLSALGSTVREQVLTALRDVALDQKIWESVKDEYVMSESLLRYVTRTTVTGQFRRIAHGDALPTPYKFSYLPPKRIADGPAPYRLEFDVNPNSPIPTNVHVLIGRNGVGKTLLLSLMAKSLVAKDAIAKQSGKFEFVQTTQTAGTFVNVVYVSFSAFDETDRLPERNPGADSIGYAYIGLRGWANSSSNSPVKLKSPQMLAREFVKSLAECQIGVRRRQWNDAIASLHSDPVFKAAELETMIERDLSTREDRNEILETFKALSSGHKIVLLTLTKLVEKVEERTLVLIDEPEGHLHPPLLSAMTRAVSKLLVRRNGVAIVATHSPIVLQEVPKSCIWIIDRILTSSRAERPSIESFAESVGILSREVFKLEISQSGYHHILGDIFTKAEDYDDALRQMQGQLGAEGKAVLRGMFLNAES